MKQLVCLTLVLSPLLLAIQARVEADIITFDEASGVFDPGYGGLNWRGINRIHVPTFSVQDSGYVRGNVSPEYTAWTAGREGAPARVSVSSGTFDFNGMFITAAWQNGLTVVLTGKLGGTTQYSQSFVIDDDSPIFTHSNFVGIDSLEIYSINGVDAGTPGSGSHVAIDNFIINEDIGMASVPEPTSMALLGFASVGGLSLCWRRRQRTQGERPAA